MKKSNVPPSNRIEKKSKKKATGLIPKKPPNRLQKQQLKDKKSAGGKKKDELGITISDTSLPSVHIPLCLNQTGKTLSHDGCIK